MELRAYWNMIRPYWWLVLGLPLVVLAISLATTPQGAVAYEARVRTLVSIAGEPPNGKYFTYDKYYSWLASEYLVDDMTELLRSGSFAGDVSQRLGQTVPPGAISGSVSTRKTHRVLDITVTHADPADAQKIAQAVASTLTDMQSKYFSQLSQEDARLTVIDGPTVGPVAAGLSKRLDLPIRVGLGLAAGLGLALLLYYLNDTIRDRREAEEVTGLPVLGEVPGGHRAEQNLA